MAEEAQKQHRRGAITLKHHYRGVDQDESKTSDMEESDNDWAMVPEENKEEGQPSNKLVKQPTV